MGWRKRLPAMPHIHFMAAAPLDAWARLLLTRGVRIGWRYWPRVLVNVALSACVTAITLPERVLLAPVLWWAGRRSGWRLGRDAARHPTGRAVADEACTAGRIDRSLDRLHETPPSIVILGYYRSGTTHLHNLLACDPGNITPRWGQVLAPQGWIVSWFILKLFLWAVLPTKRPQDDMAFGPEWPGEDDFALSNWTLTSPLPGRVVVPKAYEHFARFNDLVALTARERARWRRTQWAILSKIVVLGRGRRLLIKTPPHTARVAAITEVLGSPAVRNDGGRAPGGSRGSAPDAGKGIIRNATAEHADRRRPSPDPPPTPGRALTDPTGGQAARGTRDGPRFIYLTRDREAVLASNERLMRAMQPFLLQDAPPGDIVRARLEAEYAATEAAFEAAAPTIAPGGLCRMRYDDLIADPLTELQRAYVTLGLDWTPAFEHRLKTYLASIAAYRSETQKIADRSASPPPDLDAPAVKDSAPQTERAARAPHSSATSALARPARLITAFLLTLILWACIAWATGHRSAIFAMLGGISLGHAATARRPGSITTGVASAILAVVLSALGMLIATRLADFRAPPVPDFDTLLPAAWRRFTHESTLLWTTLGAVAAYRLGTRRSGIVPGA